MAKTKKIIDESRVPDGGWGWMVVLGVAVTNMFNQSLVSVFGLLFGQHLEEMGYESTGVALVSNVNNMVMCLSGLITGPVLQKYSCRSVSIFGSILTFLGLVMSSFATTITELLMYYSFLTGLGMGLIYPATFVAIKAYFVGRRARAVGLSLAGTGIGQMLMPQLVRWLLDEFGFNGAVRIVAALCLHGTVGSMLFHPVHWHLKPISKDTEQLLNNNNASIIKVDIIKEKNGENKNGYARKEVSNSSEVKMNNGKCQTEAKPEEEKEISPKSSWYTSLHFSLLHDPIFTNLCLGVGLAHTAGVSFGTLFPLLLQEGPLKLTRSNTALAGLDQVCNMRKRVAKNTCGFISPVYYMSFIGWRLNQNNKAELIALQSSLLGLLAASLLCGYVRALTVINQNLTISEYCSKHKLDDKLPAALGIMMVAKGVFVISLGQLLGWLRDYTKSYSLFVFGTNVLLIVVFILWAIEFIIIRTRKSKEQTNTIICES